MFGFLLNGPLSSVLAPSLSLHEEFLRQCELFIKFFTSKSESSQRLVRCRIEQTNLAERLTRICDLVLEEQREHARNEENGSISPSMEYLLHNNLFETLACLAQADSPLGIYPKILFFFIRLLKNNARLDLLPHRTVYSSLNKLLAICGKTPASPYETSEIAFLVSLTDLIVENGDRAALMNCFIRESSSPLINSLLSFLTSADAQVAKRAGETLLKLVPLFNEHAHRVICERTAFCSIVVGLIVDHYADIPRSLKASQIEQAITMFCTIDGDCGDRSIVNTNSIRKFLSFLRWYKFFDVLLCHLPRGIQLQRCLLAQFHQDFLQTCIRLDMTGEGFASQSDAIDNILLTTILLSNCLRNTENQVWFDHLSHFLIIPEREEHNSNIPSIFNNHKVCQMLLDRCDLKRLENDQDNHTTTTTNQFELASASLQLIEDILGRPSKSLIDFLIIRFIDQRNYLDTKTTHDQSHKEEVCNFPLLSNQHEVVANQLATLLPSFASPECFAFKSFDTILHLFHSLVPSELKLDDNQQIDQLDLEAYLHEAIRAFHMFLTNCYVHWNGVEDESFENVTKNEVIEPPLVKIIFDNLTRMWTLPHEINLQTCSILAKLSLIPSKHVNEYLLDPSTPIHASLGRSLFSILHQLIGSLQIQVKGIDNLRDKLIATKRTLLSNAEEPSSTKTDPILRCCIVLDEFCKELCAIIYVKHNLARFTKTSLQ